MLVSVGLRAVVGMMPLLSEYEFLLPFDIESDASGGFRRLTSSLNNCRIRDPRIPSQPDGWLRDSDF